MKILLFLLLLPIIALSDDSVYDIVRIDTGVTGKHKVIYSMHGTMMKMAADDQSLILNINPYTLDIQCIYDRESHSCMSTLSDLQTANTVQSHVISISLSGRDFDMPEETEIIKLQDNGTLIIAAAGNDYGLKPGYPGAYGGACVLSVGSLIDGKLANYSNYADIYMEQVDDERGTSFSTARMAVIAAKLMSHGIKCNEAADILRSVYGKRTEGL